MTIPKATRLRMRIEALRCLANDCKARIVPCYDDGSPIDPRWRENGARWDDVRRHATGGGRIGVVPSSLHLIVVTLHPDTGSTAGNIVHDEVGEEPIVSFASREGERQLFFREGAEAPATATRWLFGRVIHDHEYVALEDPERLVVALAGCGRPYPANTQSLPDQRVATRSEIAGRTTVLAPPKAVGDPHWRR